MPTAERILVGAGKAFGRLGYAAVRVEDILEAAGVSRPTFYKLFRTKEEVFQRLSERHHREIRELVRAVPRDTALPPLRLLEAMVTAFLAWRAGLGPVGRLLDAEARTPGSPFAGERKRTLHEMTALMNALLAAQGRAPVDPVLIVALIASLESVADQLLSGKRRNPEALSRAVRVGTRIVGGALARPEEAAELGPPPPLPS